MYTLLKKICRGVCDYVIYYQYISPDCCLTNTIKTNIRTILIKKN